MRARALRTAACTGRPAASAAALVEIPAVNGVIVDDPATGKPKEIVYRDYVDISATNDEDAATWCVGLRSFVDKQRGVVLGHRRRDGPHVELAEVGVSDNGAREIFREAKAPARVGSAGHLALQFGQGFAFLRRDFVPCPLNCAFGFLFGVGHDLLTHLRGRSHVLWDAIIGTNWWSWCYQGYFNS